MSHEYRRLLLVAALLGCAGAHAADGALDTSFGSGGKVIIAGPHGGSTATGFNYTATDLATQPDGKIVVIGYETYTYSDNSQLEEWNILRLNADGSLDTTFGTGGRVTTSGGVPPTRPQSVALRADGRIVVGGNVMNPGELGVVEQFTSSGRSDSAFGTSGYIILEPANGDSTSISRMVLEPNGSIDVAGTYYANQSGFNSNEFYFVRISADGKTVEPFQYLLGSGPNADDHAQDLAIDSQGRYVVAGYHRGANGDYDFAAIRIRSDLYDVDNTFGSGGQTTVDFKDTGDYANAVALTPTGYIVLGGQAYGQAALALLDPEGNLYRYYLGDQSPTAQLQFVYGSGGGADTITKLIIDGYDTKYPQLLAVGSGNQSYASGPGGAAGLMFGIARLNLPETHSNFNLDSGFNGRGTEGVYFNIRPSGIGSFLTTNHGNSAAFANGKLILVGDTLGTDMAVTRLAAFDGIFENGFDNPSL